MRSLHEDLCNGVEKLLRSATVSGASHREKARQAAVAAAAAANEGVPDPEFLKRPVLPDISGEDHHGKWQAPGTETCTFPPPALWA